MDKFGQDYRQGIKQPSLELFYSFWRKVIVWVIRIYQLVVSPFLMPCCRFHPNCSSYAIEAISKHGSVRGCWLMCVRLLKCHPWHPGGVDHVP